MKILLDECVTKHLKPHLKEYSVFTVNEMRWSGIKNGMLMSLCVENNFDILLTIDKNLMYQQNLPNYNITIAVLNGQTSKLNDIIPFMESFKFQVNSFEKKKAYLVEK